MSDPQILTCAEHTWKDSVRRMRTGEPFECDEEFFEYWLGVLPPVYMGRTVVLPNGRELYAQFGFAEG